MNWWQFGLLIIGLAAVAWIIPAIIFGYALGAAVGVVARSAQGKGEGHGG